MVTVTIVVMDHYNSWLQLHHPVVAEVVEDMPVLQIQPFSGWRSWFLFKIKIKRLLSTGLIIWSVAPSVIPDWICNAWLTLLEVHSQKRPPFWWLSTTSSVRANSQHKSFSLDVITAFDYFHHHCQKPPVLKVNPLNQSWRTEKWGYNDDRPLKGKWIAGCGWTRWKTSWLAQ